MTATSFTGNLGGLAGADAWCQLAATSGRKGGTWVAFLATSTAAGVSRMTVNGPWYQQRSDGTFVLTYNNTANMQTGALASLQIDEQGRSSGSAYFWTGMNTDGTTSAQGNCSNWASATAQGAVGSYSSLNQADLFVTSPYSCGNVQRLLCVEQ